MIYIALLRGINVGGKNIIKMVDLKNMFELMGFLNVQTYIQSGNVVFISKEKDEVLLQKKIEQEILSTFGFNISVILRNIEEWESILQNCPFSKNEILKAETSAEGKSFYVALLTTVPTKENIEYLRKHTHST